MLEDVAQSVQTLGSMQGDLGLLLSILHKPGMVASRVGVFKVIFDLDNELRASLGYMKHYLEKQEKQRKRKPRQKLFGHI